MAKNDKDYVQELEDKISKLEGDVKEKVIENQSTRHSSDGKWVYRSDIMTHRNRLQITLEEFETEQENLNAKLEQNQSRIFGVQGALTSILAILGEGLNPFDAPDEIQNLLAQKIEKKELDGNTIEVDNEYSENSGV